MLRRIAALAALLLLSPPALSQPVPPAARAEALLRAEAAALVADPVVLDALRRANREREGLTPGAIRALDERWRGEAKGGPAPFVRLHLDSPASDRLRDRREAGAGRVANLFVYDRLGLNVAQTWVTHDYWQGDEDQYRLTVPKGPGALQMGPEEQDDVVNRPVIAGSMTLTDPADGAVLGAVTVVFDLANLRRSD